MVKVSRHSGSTFTSIWGMPWQIIWKRKIQNKRSTLKWNSFRIFMFVRWSWAHLSFSLNSPPHFLLDCVARCRWVVTSFILFFSCFPLCLSFAFYPRDPRQRYGDLNRWLSAAIKRFIFFGRRFHRLAFFFFFLLNFYLEFCELCFPFFFCLFF